MVVAIGAAAIAATGGLAAGAIAGLAAGAFTSANLVVAGTAATGLVAFGFGAADIVEGVHETSLGIAGDTEKAAINPVRDTLFQNNPDDYYLVETVATFGAAQGTQVINQNSVYYSASVGKQSQSTPTSTTGSSVQNNQNSVLDSSKKTPSEIARSWQGSGKYPGIDEYKDVTVKEGTVLYRGEPNGTEYFTTLDAIEDSGRNATTIFEGLQVEKNPIHGYRGEMQGYLFNEDVPSAYGITNANPQFGKGGLPQYFVPGAQELINKGILTPTDKIQLLK